MIDARRIDARRIDARRIDARRIDARRIDAPVSTPDLIDATRLLEFLRQHRLAVQASVSTSSEPQAAVIGFAVTDQLEIVFDTVGSTRKARNLQRNPKIALAIGGLSEGDERTVQYEGIADLPSGDELERLKRDYYAVFPDGPSRLSWTGLVYVRVRPTWIRYSDYNLDPPQIVEFGPEQLLL